MRQLSVGDDESGYDEGSYIGGFSWSSYTVFRHVEDTGLLSPVVHCSV
jgi:hypothetical protein